VISVGGLAFDIGGSVPLSSGELRLIAGIDRLAVSLISEAVFTMALSATAPWTPKAEQRPQGSSPARLHIHGDVVRVAHANLIGEFDVVTRRGTYARFNDSAGPLRIMLRAAFAASLPLFGGVPLHSAAVIDRGEAYVFFGESGAGKTTIARIAAQPVISDEIVAMTVENSRVFARATGFGDDVDAPPVAAAPVPIAALVRLSKGPSFALERIPRRDALPELLKVVLSPLHPLAWKAALDVIARVVATGVPLVDMTWSASRSPISDLVSFVGEARRSRR
jgi:Phosphoenolpyruvate carboxykinase